MMFKKRMAAALLAAASMTFLTGGTVRADYMYQTSVTFTPVSDVGLNITPVGGSVVGDGPVNATLLDLSYAPTASGSSSQTINVIETLTGTPGTEMVSIIGTLAYTYLPGFVASHFTPLSESVTGSGYSVPTLFLNCQPSQPDGLKSTLTAAILPAATTDTATTPLPKSATAGLSLLGLLGLTRLLRRGPMAAS